MVDRFQRSNPNSHKNHRPDRDGPAIDERDAVAAAVIETDRKQCLAALQAHADALAVALIEARKALHHHYVEWDGEPEDAVPLQLARSQCDQALRAYEEFCCG